MFPLFSSCLFFKDIFKLANQGHTTFSEEAKWVDFSGINLWGKVPVKVRNLFPFLSAFQAPPLFLPLHSA